MRNLKNGLVFAMEEDTPEVPQDQPMVPETQAEVETASAEVAEQVGEIEQVETATVDAEADAATLGEVQEVMQESVEKGEGLDETAAEVAEIAVEAICARLGLRSSTKAIPSMESFGSKSSRLAATKIAIESIGEKIKAIWEAILKAVRWVWEKIKSFWLGLTKSRGQLLKHLEGLQKRVADMPADHEATSKTVSGTAAKAFAIGGKADAGTAEKVLDNCQKLMKSVPVAAEFSATIASKMIDPKGKVAEMNEAGKQLLDKIRGAMESLGKVEGSSKGGDKKITAHYGNLPYGKSVMVSSSEDGDNASITVSLEDNSKGEAKEAAVLTKEQMNALLDKAIVLVKELQSVEKVEKDLEKVAKACEGVTQAVLKGAANQAEGEEAAAIKTAAANIRSLNSMVAKFGSSLPGAAFQGAKAAGDYVVASLAAHGKKKEEKKD